MDSHDCTRISHVFSIRVYPRPSVANTFSAACQPSGSFLRRVVQIGPIAYSASIYGEWPVYTTHSDRHGQLANRLICNVLNTTYVYTGIGGSVSRNKSGRRSGMGLLLLWYIQAQNS